MVTPYNNLLPDSDNLWNKIRYTYILPGGSGAANTQYNLMVIFGEIPALFNIALILLIKPNIH